MQHAADPVDEVPVGVAECRNQQRQLADVDIGVGERGVRRPPGGAAAVPVRIRAMNEREHLEGVVEGERPGQLGRCGTHEIEVAARKRSSLI